MFIVVIVYLIYKWIETTWSLFLQNTLKTALGGACNLAQQVQVGRDFLQFCFSQWPAPLLASNLGQ